ncbi:hypothetical protein [Nonomuraea sp. NPDC048826]|uniref:hypothetical protein n=1 Tax=Nonomuraea sp. NPDC048826 TaxID=3364347 RepID=UPI0037110FC6
MRNQPHEPGGTRLSYRPSGIPIARGDAGAYQSEAQAAAEAAALIKFGRDTAPHAQASPDSVVVDVGCLTDDELTEMRKLMGRMAGAPSAHLTGFGKFTARLAESLKLAEERRAWTWIEFLYDEAAPPDWDTAVVALLEGEGEG